MSKRKPFNSLEISGMISEEGLTYSKFPAKLGQGVPSGRKQVSLCAATLRTAGGASGGPQGR